MRGSGTTTKLLKNAKEGAIFIWVNSVLGYPRQLAHDLGRGDIKIYGPSILDDHRLAGVQVPEIILDHAAQLTEIQMENFSKYSNRMEMKENAL